MTTNVQICKAPSDHIISKTTTAPNFYSLCTNSPKLSPRNVTLQSPFCHLHTNLNKKSKSKLSPSPPQADLRPVTRNFARLMLDKEQLLEPSKDSDDIGCRSSARIKVTRSTRTQFCSILPSVLVLGVQADLKTSQIVLHYQALSFNYILY